MKNHKEFMEAILAGEILYKDVTDVKIKLCPTTGNLVLQQGNSKWVPYLFYDYPHYQDWRILPKTININGIEVPEPERKPLKFGQIFYLASTSSYRPRVLPWRDVEWDYMWLNHGLIHLTEEAAIIHRDALLSFTQK